MSFTFNITAYGYGLGFVIIGWVAGMLVSYILSSLASVTKI